jgi:hypothetical protein
MAIAPTVLPTGRTSAKSEADLSDWPEAESSVGSQLVSR